MRRRWEKVAKFYFKIIYVRDGGTRFGWNWERCLKARLE